MISAPYMLDDIQINKIISQFDESEYEIFIPQVNEKLSEEELMNLSILDVEGIICGDDEFTKRVIDNLPKLKVIVKWGTGIDSIDKKYAETKGIKVLNTPDAFTVPVAETTIGLILTFIRNINKNNILMKQGQWKKPKGKTIEELTIGIIGFGKIGSKVAKLLHCFGNHNIIYYDIKQKLTNISKYKKLHTLIKESDIISLHCDLNETSEYILNKDMFKIMNKKPIIINTARGKLINQNDLIEALINNQISGAGLDVYENEPIINKKLKNMDNVVMLSHNSNSSQKYWDYVHQNSIKMLKENI